MPDLSPNEQFQAVLAIANSQLRTKKIQVRFGPAGKMRFIVDEASLKDALVGSSVSDESFRKIFHNEISPLLEAIIRNAVEQYSDIPFTHGNDPKERADRKAIIQERAELIKKSLVNDGLRARYLIKASSKHPRLRVPSWEVGKKAALSTKEPWLHPYATLSFETILPEQSLGFLSWLPFFGNDSIGRSEFCVFDCDEDDLDDLIQTLQDAKAALRQVVL